MALGLRLDRSPARVWVLLGDSEAAEGVRKVETDEIDLLEGGIEVIAKPPGKEPRAISQLSGGEKTLPAVALLFAIFQSKPSCFRVLDEVVRQEGHGDDAQLVVVSHRATDEALSATVETLRGMDFVRDVSSVMRVEGDQ